MNLNLDKGTWERITFGDVAANINEYFDRDRDGVLPFVAGPHINPGQPSVVHYGSTEDDNFPPTFKRKFHKGDVLLHSRGIEKLVAVDRLGVTGEKLFVLRTRHENALLQEFLLWLLLSPSAQAHMKDNFTGSVNKFLNWKPLAAMNLDLPPVDEQKCIADLLWAVERHRSALCVRWDAMDRAIVIRLGAWWESDRKRKIGDIADCVTGSTPSKSNNEYWNPAEIPFYTPSEIEGDTVRAAHQRVSVAGAGAGRVLPKYAVAVACIGGDMGKSGVIVEPGISNQQITSVVGLVQEDAFVLQALLAHPMGRAAMEARETTTIVRKLNKSDLMRVEVPWPEDRSTIRQIVNRRRCAAAPVVSELDRLTALRSAIISNVFGCAT